MTVDERLLEIFRSVFADDALMLRNDMTAADIDAWDSVAHINLMFAIEQEFGFQFPGNELAEMENIGELKDYLAQKVDR